MGETGWVAKFSVVLPPSRGRPTLVLAPEAPRLRRKPSSGGSPSRDGGRVAVSRLLEGGRILAVSRRANSVGIRTSVRSTPLICKALSHLFLNAGRRDLALLGQGDGDLVGAIVDRGQDVALVAELAQVLLDRPDAPAQVGGDPARQRREREAPCRCGRSGTAACAPGPTTGTRRAPPSPRAGARSDRAASAGAPGRSAAGGSRGSGPSSIGAHGAARRATADRGSHRTAPGPAGSSARGRRKPLPSSARRPVFASSALARAASLA